MYRVGRFKSIASNSRALGERLTLPPVVVFLIIRRKIVNFIFVMLHVRND